MNERLRRNPAVDGGSINEFKYEIGGKTYIQRPLVLGQVRQICDLLQDVTIPGNADMAVIIGILGDGMPEALGMVPALAEEIEFEITGEQIMQVIDDFFSCNPIASYLERLTGMLNAARKKVIKRTGLKKSASSSPEETSPKGMPSSGDTPPESASPGSDTAPGMACSRT